jgi:hypothetical protein
MNIDDKLESILKRLDVVENENKKLIDKNNYLAKKIDDLSKKNQVGYAYNRAKTVDEDDSLDEVEISE